MKYKYSATKDTDPKKLPVHGMIQADSQAEAKQLLSRQGLTVYRLEEQKTARGHEISFGGPSRTEVVLFTKNLSVMMKSGLTLAESLQISIEQSHGGLRRVLTRVLRHVENGEPFAKALATQSKYFPRLYQDMVRVGEVSGTLDQNLAYLADQLAKDRDMRRKVWGALMYPLLILVGVGGLGAMLSVVVLPRLTNLFLSLDVPLPLSTRILIGVSAFLQSYGLWVLLGVIVLIIILVAGYRIRPVKYAVHALLLRIPLFGRLLHQISLARFTRTLGALLLSGVPISESLDAVEEAMSNMVYERAVRKVRTATNKGASLANSLERHSRLFPRVVTRMVNVGERSGRLDEILKYLSEFYEEEFDEVAKNLTVLLEPALLILIGVVVGFMGVSIITPIYQVTNAIG